MKWNRYQSTCPFRKEKIVEYSVEIGEFTLSVSPSNSNPLKWFYGVSINYSFLMQRSDLDSPKQAKEAAIAALRKFLKDTTNLLPPEKEKK